VDSTSRSMIGVEDARHQSSNRAIIASMGPYPGYWFDDSCRQLCHESSNKASFHARICSRIGVNYQYASDAGASIPCAAPTTRGSDDSSSGPMGHERIVSLCLTSLACSHDIGHAYVHVHPIATHGVSSGVGRPVEHAERGRCCPLRHRCLRHHRHTLHTIHLVSRYGVGA